LVVESSRASCSVARASNAGGSSGFWKVPGVRTVKAAIRSGKAHARKALR
jgi:hypothetical protein